MDILLQTQQQLSSHHHRAHVSNLLAGKSRQAALSSGKHCVSRHLGGWVSGKGPCFHRSCPTHNGWSFARAHASSRHSSSSSTSSSTLQQGSLGQPAHSRDVTVLVSAPHDSKTSWHEEQLSTAVSNGSGSADSSSSTHDLLDRLVAPSQDAFGLQPTETSASNPQTVPSSIFDSPPSASMQYVCGDVSSGSQPSDSSSSELRMGISDEQMRALDQLLHPSSDAPPPSTSSQAAVWLPHRSTNDSTTMQLAGGLLDFPVPGGNPVLLYSLASERLEAGTSARAQPLGSQDVDAQSGVATQAGHMPTPSPPSSSMQQPAASNGSSSPEPVAQEEAGSSSSDSSSQTAALMDAAATAASKAIEVVSNVATEVGSLASEAVRALTPPPPDAASSSKEGTSSPSGEAAARSHSGASTSTATSSVDEAGGGQPSDGARKWALGVLTGTYMHQAATSFSIPLMIPMISASLKLTDIQSALLTTGYSYLYAAALVPMGLIADRVKRTRLLGTGVAGWSALSLAASHAATFTDLFLARVGLAAAQSTQNIVAFSMVPDLFPKNKSTAVALYNTAIYIGRGLMYLAVNLARASVSAQPEYIDAASKAAHVVHDSAGNIMVPLDQVDLSLVQVMYVMGDMAAIRAAPLYGLHEEVTTLATAMPSTGDLIWRQVLSWLGIPGLALAVAMLLTVQEPPRAGAERGMPAPAAAAAAPAPSSSTIVTSSSIATAAAAPPPNAVAASSVTTAVAPGSGDASASQHSDTSLFGPLLSLFSNKPFMVISAAAALNDVASYALIAWQSTLFERCLGLKIEDYAPVLATLLPVAGILGGVGGGYLADRLTPRGLRWLVTVGASFVAVPFFWLSVKTDSPQVSFAALGVAFALSEAWRAPAAVMARSVVSPAMTSTAMSLYLSLRNVAGGFGPIVVAQLLAAEVGLQDALQFVPFVYFLSACTFLASEQMLAAARQQAKAQAALQEGEGKAETAEQGLGVSGTGAAERGGIGEIMAALGGAAGKKEHPLVASSAVSKQKQKQKQS